MRPVVLDAGAAASVLRSMAKEAATRHGLLLKAAGRVEAAGKPLAVAELERIVSDTGRMALPPVRPPSGANMTTNRSDAEAP